MFSHFFERVAEQNARLLIQGQATRPMTVTEYLQSTVMILQVGARIGLVVPECTYS